MPLRDTRKLIIRMQEDMRAIATALCESPVSDYAQYREQVGRYQGVKQSLTELRKDIDDGDDDPL